MKALGLSPKDRLSHDKKLSAARNARWWKNLSDEQRSAFKKRSVERRRAKRKAMTAEQLCSHRAMQCAYNKQRLIARGVTKEDMNRLARERYRKAPLYFISYSKRYLYNRRRTDPAFRLLDNLRCRLREAVKTRRGRILNLVGCSIENLVSHLESQFKPGMTWENYGRGGWHVDHRKPCAAFNMSDVKQMLECFHFTNLQPLWHYENLKKGAKWLDLH